MLVLILRSAHAQALPQNRKSVRASRRMRTTTAWPSCFETHRSAGRQRKHLRSRRTQVGFTRLARLKRPISGLPEIGCDAPQHEGGRPARFGQTKSREEPTFGCKETTPAPFACFRPVIYREPRNSNVSRAIA